MEKRLVTFSERLGDRIALKYIAEISKIQNPELELYSYEEFKYSSVKEFYMKDWASDLFKDNFYNIKDVPSIEHLYRPIGNYFVYVPYLIKKYNIYPSLTVPDKYNQWLKERFGDLYYDKRKKICFHILTDAPYARSRNHNYNEWKGCIEQLSKERDVLLFRIGKNTRNNINISGDNIFDLTNENLTPSQSISIISMCDIYAGGDTGMTHAAGALGKDIVGVWGDISPNQEMSEINPDNSDELLPWDSGPYVSNLNKLVLYRNQGLEEKFPVFNKEQIKLRINYFLDIVGDKNMVVNIDRYKHNSALSEEKIESLIVLTKTVIDLPGDTAEVGVWRGGSSRLISEHLFDKLHFAIDTYEGIPNSDSTMDEHLDGEFSNTDHNDVRKFIDQHNVCIVKGYFPDVINRFDLENRRFCLVHIDGDTYRTTIDSLNFFFPRMVSGGVMIFDDYEWGRCPGVKKALDEFTKDIVEDIEVTAPCQCIIRKI
jgi:O-methyltransferase